MTVRERELLDELFKIHQLEDYMLNTMLSRYFQGSPVYMWLQSMRMPIRNRRSDIEQEIAALRSPKI